MFNNLKSTLIGVCLGLIFSGSALAANPQKPAEQKVAFLVFDTPSKSFADFLAPGINLGDDLSPLFKKTPGVTWFIESFFLYLPSVNQGLGEILAFNRDDTLPGSPLIPITTSPFLSIGHFSSPFILVFYQEQVSAVPEAGAGVMMAMGLPVLGWVAWRRQRRENDPSNPGFSV